MRGLPSTTQAATAVPAATSKVSDVIDSILGIRSMTARKPMAAPTTAPAMRSVPFWTVAPSVPSPTIRQVITQVRIPGQLTAFCSV